MEDNNIKNIYIKKVLKNARIILTQLDRDPDSPTFGCFDRNFWHYKIRDFPSMILQQNCLTLALLYKNDFEGNLYYKKKKIRDYAIAAMRFWSKRQHRDGSFDEYFPNEHSIPPTVFSLYAVCEAYKIIELKDIIIKKKIRKAAIFLAKKTEKEALNQEIGSMCAIYNAFLVTKIKYLSRTAKFKFKKLKKLQSKEGWFSEYQGADIGYLSVSLNYLAEYYRLSEQKDAVSMIDKILDFIQYFIHPDGSLGGDYGSRNTQYFLFNGLELSGKQNPVAYSIRNKVIQSKLTIDERYLTHYCVPSLTYALINYQDIDQELPKLPYETRFAKYFSDSGLFVFSDAKTYLISNLKKLGTLSVFNNGKKILNDCGYRFKIKKNTFAITNWIRDDYEIKVKKDSVTTTGFFSQAKFIQPSPIKHMILRVLTFFFRSSLMPILKRTFISPNKKTDVKYSRQIKVNSKNINIVDEIKSDNVIREIHSTDSLSMRFCPSSRFFEENDVDNINKELSVEDFKELRVNRKIDLENNMIEIEYDTKKQK